VTDPGLHIYSHSPGSLRLQKPAGGRRMGGVRTGVGCLDSWHRDQGCSAGRGGCGNPEIPARGPWRRAAQQAHAGGWQAKAHRFELIKDKSF